MVRQIPVFVRVILDIVCLLAVGLPILLFHLLGRPFLRGFNCDDESIRYPFKTSTITNNTLYCVGILVPTFVIILTEVIQFFTNGKTSNQQYRFLKWDVHPLVWQVYRKLGYFCFGACLSQLTTDIAKYSIGRLRPHFYDVCNPSVNCNHSSNQHIYIDIDKYKCLGDDVNLIREARLSFMSGHSSFSAYTMVFLVLYLQSRMTYRDINLLRPFLQALCLYAAWYTALSRISDYKHHWSDVLAGSTQGVIVALIAVFFISDLFPRRRGNNPALLDKEQPDYNSCVLQQRS